MDSKTLLLILIPIIIAIVSSYMTYFFTVKQKKTETILKFKEEQYTHLIVFLQGFMEGTTSGELKKKFLEESYKSWLYCSDDVAKAIDNFIEFVVSSSPNIPDAETGRNAVGKIVLEMRKDLLGKTKLTQNNFKYRYVTESNIPISKRK